MPLISRGGTLPDLKPESLMTSNTPAKGGEQTLAAIINSDAGKQQFAAALPRHITPDRFVRTALSALNRTPALKDCTQQSVLKCLMDCSSMGLEPDGRHAHLIPYKRECTLIVDYKGFVALVRRSGEVATIHADVVCEGDEFDHNLGEVTCHRYDLRRQRGSVYAAYAQVTMKNGGKQSAIMGLPEINAIRSRSKAGNNGPWVTDFNEMAKKTAFRRLVKWLPISSEIMNHVTMADEHEFGPVNQARIMTTPINPFSQSVIEQPTPTAADPVQPVTQEPEEHPPGLRDEDLPVFAGDAPTGGGK